MAHYTVEDLPNHLKTLISNGVAMTSEDDILEVIKSLRDKFGITYFAHVISFHDGRTTTLISNHEVAIHWVVKQYAIPGNNHQGAYLSSGYYLVSYMGDLYPKEYQTTLLELFNIDHMLLIVDSNSLYIDIFSFATERDNFKIVNFYLNNKDILKKFILHYKEKCKNLINKAIQECVLLPPASLIVPDPKNIKIDFNKTFPKIQLTDNTCLTKREVECLLLVSKGKTTKEVAKIMKISPRTVEFFINKCKSKLECSSKSKLIDKFINLVDKNILL
jgi:DNA-binding CsgD family transcriptional regulator